MMRFSWLLTLLAFAAVSSAFNLGDIRIDGVEEYIHHGQKRQATGTGNTSPAPPPSTAPPPPSSTRPPPPPPQTTPTPTPTQDPPTTAQPPSSPGPGTSRQNTPTQRSSAAPPPSSAPNSEPPRSTIVRTSPLVSTSQQVFTTTFVTESNGAQIEVTSTGTNSVPITTGLVETTETPNPQSNGGDNGGGLSDSNKKVIGGVVGGIGGALLLGGIALVFWRMKKRQHKVTADDDDLNLNTGAALGDKPHNGTGPSPFQSNLEQYHNPGGRPNAAANF